MKKAFALILIFSLTALGFGSSSAQSNFDSFWKKFRAAVTDKDKNTVAALSKFPLSMPYGSASVKSKTALAKRFKEIFDGDANAADCFAAEKPEKLNSKTYEIACSFRNDTESGTKPFVYSFELTKTGWKLTGLDNINE